MKSLKQDLADIGAVKYTFPKNIDSRIEAFCRNKKIPVYEVPEIDKMRPIENEVLFKNIKGQNKTFIISRIFTRERIMCVRPSDFVGLLIGELEFALWHECGHVDLTNPETDKLHDEKYADIFAINRLMEYYDGETAKYIYLRWLFKEYEMNPKTGEYVFDDPFKQYTHRREWLDQYANGIENYQKYFD